MNLPTEPLAARLHQLAAAVDTLPATTAERLHLAILAADRDLAIREAAALLDPTRRFSIWATAGALAARLDRFEATAWPRIRNGHRQPRDDLESALARILACPTCPRSQRRLTEAL